MAMIEVLPALTLQSGEKGLNSAVIDTSKGFAYFAAGWFADPPSIVKIRLSDFTEVSPSIFDPTSGWNFFSVVLDDVNGFIYWGDGDSHILKIDTSTFIVASILNLDIEDDWLNSADIDTAKGFAYFTTMTPPRHVIKIDLSTFTKVGTVDITLVNAHAQSFSVMDTINGFMYVALAPSGGFPVSVDKIDLSTFTLAESINLLPDKIYVGSFIIDVINGFAYVISQSSPVKMVKIDLSTFTEVATLSLDDGSGFVFTQASVINVEGGFAYVGFDWPGKVVKVDLSTFSVVQTLTASKPYLDSAVIDPINKFIYFGTGEFPTAHIIKVSDPDIKPPTPPTQAPLCIIKRDEGIYSKPRYCYAGEGIFTKK